MEPEGAVRHSPAPKGDAVGAVESSRSASLCRRCQSSGPGPRSYIATSDGAIRESRIAPKATPVATQVALLGGCLDDAREAKAL